MTFFFFGYFLTDMKFFVAVCFLTICAVTAQSRFAEQRQEYDRDSVQKNHDQGYRRGFLKHFFNDPRDPGGYSAPIGSISAALSSPVCAGSFPETAAGNRA